MENSSQDHARSFDLDLRTDFIELCDFVEATIINNIGYYLNFYSDLENTFDDYACGLEL